MTRRLRIVLILYRALWLAGLPLVLFYFKRRARRDPAYGQNMRERWGHGPVLEGAVWVHAVSLGEMRSATPLVRALLDQGEKVVTTHLTPAGRKAAEDAFADEITQGRLVARYLPFELGMAYRRFLSAMRPKLALSLEVEIWPVMIAETARAGVPLFLANSQIPSRSYPRAKRLARLLGHPVSGLAGVFAKSKRHAERFRTLGAPNVQATGELRFDQPIPERLIQAAAALKPQLKRPVVAVASVVEGEDALYLEAYKRLKESFRTQGKMAPLFIHIPRAPERFSLVGDMLKQEDQTILKRSNGLDKNFSISDPDILNSIDILLGDSMGEMYFYLALSNIAVVGGGFLPSGAHNVIEPLALKKPVLTGPNIWTIEYPAQEAIEASVLQLCKDPAELAAAIEEVLSMSENNAEKAEGFFANHAGATARTMEHLIPLLALRPDVE